MFVADSTEPSDVLHKTWGVEKLQISNLMYRFGDSVVNLLVLGVVIPVVKNVRVFQYLLGNLTPEQITTAPT
jgi:hypothetical protein